MMNLRFVSGLKFNRTGKPLVLGDLWSKERPVQTAREQRCDRVGNIAPKLENHKRVGRLTRASEPSESWRKRGSIPRQESRRWKFAQLVARQCPAQGSNPHYTKFCRPWNTAAYCSLEPAGRRPTGGALYSVSLSLPQKKPDD
jgi:hypothetical protein